MNRKRNLRLLTDATARDGGKPRAVVLEISPAWGDIITIRLAGRRRRYVLPIESLYWYAARLEAERLRREKADKRKARKDGRQ